MTQERLAAIVAALENDQHDQYEELVTAFARSDRALELWKALGEAHGSAFNLFERLSAWPVESVRVAIHKLMPAVEYVPSPTLSDTVQFLQFAKRAPPSFRYSVAEQLRPHLARSPDLGKHLGESLRQGEVAGEGATRVWAGAFGSAACKQAAEYAVGLLAGSVGDVALLAVQLQYLPASSSEVAEVLRPTESKLAGALVKAASSIGRDAWYALTSISGYSPSAMIALQQAINTGEVSALAAVTDWLHTISSPTVGATVVPLEDLVTVLLQHAVQNPGVRSWVDSAVASLMFRDGLRGVVLPCVAELGRVNDDLAELLPNVLSAVCDKPEDFTKLLTGWLVADDVSFPAIRSLLSRCPIGQAPAELDGGMFAAAPPVRRVAAARRLLALTHNGPVLCRFIASLAETPVLQPDGLELAAQMLNEAFAEFPAATEKFLKARTRPAERKEPFAHVYRGVYANALRWRRVLARLPQLNELRPTDAQLHALRAMRRRVNRDIMRGAAERSVLAALVTNVHVAQGRRFATHAAHGAPQVVNMQEASHAIELPSSELADPIGGMLQRAKTLAASR
ncbi:MAG: hypothetical protein WD886_06340 [Burkholderiales bacterium]